MLAASCVALVAALWAVLGSQWILPALSANSDEGLYLLQADALTRGQLAPAAPTEDAAAYAPWFSKATGDRYVLKYSPVHASVLAAGTIATGTPRTGLAVTAAAQVLLVIALARELGAGRRAAVAGGALFTLAPLVVQLDITYLAYGTSLALLLATATAAWRAHRTSSRVAAGVAGLCLGLAVFARPYDAALFASALAASLGLRHVRMPRDVRPRLGWLAGAGALGVVLPLLALLVFNREMTGDALRLPFRLLDPSDAPGLGLRRTLPTDGYLDYTFADAASSLARNLLLVTVWSAGGVVGCCLAGVAIIRRRFEGWTLLVSVLLVWPVGYALFWGSYVAAYLWDGALFIGPFYYLPMVAMLAIGAGVGLVDLRDRLPLAAGAAVLAALLLSGAVVVPRLDEQRDRTAPREAVARAVAGSIEVPALVFVPPVYGPYLQNPLSFLRNRADLDGPVLYALDRGAAANQRVLAAHPDRTAYRLALPDGWSDQPGFDPKATVEPVRVDR